MSASFWTIFQKEWLTVYKDRRTLLTNLFVFAVGLPLGGLLPSLALMFAMIDQFSQSLEVAVSGLDQAPRLVQFVEENDRNHLRLVPVSEVEAAVRSQKYFVGLIIPPNFETDLNAYQPTKVEVITSQGRILDTYGLRVSNLLVDFRDEQLVQRMREKELPTEFFKPFTIESHAVVTERRFQRSAAGWLLAMLLMAYGFSVGMTKAVNLTAGEKEHLTMEVLLLSPASRAGIVLGKAAFILTYGLASLLLAAASLSLMSVLLLYFIAQKLKISTLVLAGKMGDVYGVTPAAAPAAITQELAAALLVMIVLAFFCLVIFTLLQMIVGFWARNESQANNVLLAVNFLPSLASIPFFLDTYAPPLWHYAIPLLGPILLMPDLLVNRWEMGPLVVTLVSSLLTIGLFVWLTAWMLRQEAIIART